jgi:glycosyltransferase involved in cell wall biosynthesis
MKIVYFIDHLRPDGAQFVLKQLVQGLGKKGHQQSVICLNNSWDDLLVNQLKEGGTEVEIIGKTPLLLGYGLAKIWNLLRRENFDAIVTILFVSDVIGRVMGRTARIPNIISNIQTHDEFYTGFQRWLVRGTMPLTNHVVIPSDNYRDFVIEEEGAPPQKISIIYNFIQDGNYQNPISREELFKELGLSLEKRLIGCAGRLTHQKGYDVLIKALSEVKLQDFFVFIAGVGEEEENLRDLADRLRISSRIYWAGYRRDLPRALGALDLFVQPSRYEGMPIAVLEAMASGCPIVATAVDGTKELIEDGVHGWLVPPDDPSALASTIERAINNPQLAKTMGINARERVSRHFSYEAMISAWEDILLN